MKPVPPRIKIRSGLPAFATRGISELGDGSFSGVFGCKPLAPLVAQRMFRASAATVDDVRKVLREVDTEASVVRLSFDDRLNNAAEILFAC